jgi:hypothetical protein
MVPVEFTLLAEVHMEGMADSGIEEGEIGLGIKVVITSRNYVSYLMGFFGTA